MFYFIFYSLNSASLVLFLIGFGLIFLIERFSSSVILHLRPVNLNWNGASFRASSVLPVYESHGRYF